MVILASTHVQRVLLYIKSTFIADKRVHGLYVQAFEGIPAPYDKVRRSILPSCFREIKLKPNRRYAPVGRLAAETGWKYQDVIATLEAKRKAKAELYWENKQKKKALKATAAANVAEKTAAIDAQLAELGY